MSLPRRSDRKKKQTQLSFTPLPSSSPARSLAHVRVNETSSPAKRRRINNTSPIAGLSDSQSSPIPLSRHSHIQVVVESPSSKSPQLPTPAASSQLDKQDPEDVAQPRVPNEDDVIANRRDRKPKAALPESLSSEESEPVTPSSRSIRRAAPSSGLKTPTTRKTPIAKRLIVRNFLLGGSSGTAPLSHTQRRNSGTPWKGVQQPRQSRISSAESDSDSCSKASPQQCRRKKSTAKPRQNDSTRVSSENHTTSESDVIPTPGPNRRHKTRFLKPEADKEEGSDLAEEVEDLHDIGAEVRQSRTRGRSNNIERNKRQNRLEELRRRRAGLVEIEDDSECRDSEEAFHPMSGSESAAESERKEDTWPGWSNNPDEYDEDFVDDEGDATLGVDLARAGIPIELTGQNKMKPLEYFKYEVEWMIHNKIDPAFERNDEIYLMARKKLNDEVQGHAGSTFRSAAWNSEFVRALTRRPDIFRTDVPTMFEHKCDACSRSGHPPKHKLTFHGNSYDKNSLEKISEKPGHDSDSSEDSEDDHRSAAEPEDNFFVGRFCCANAEIAHALYHWRYHLNQTILAWLMSSGYTSHEKIIQRESWSRRKRNKLAIKIVDGMVDNGEMRDLYKQFKENLEAARSAKPDRFSSGRRDTDFR